MPHNHLLAFDAGMRDSHASNFAIGVDSRRSNDASHGITITNGIGQPLEVEGPSALCTAVSIGRSIKCVAGRCWGKEPKLCCVHLLVDCENQVDASHKRGVTVTSTECLASYVSSIDRGGASSI